MSNMTTSEWSLSCAWGKIAMVSWGSPQNPPVLLVHGQMDTAATFLPLMDKLPDTYYYVAFDLPGYGKSDPYPDGILPIHIHFVEPIRTIIEHLQWNKFIYMGHSLGFIIGLFYNLIYPNQIIKMVNIDPAQAMSFYFTPHGNDHTFWYPLVADYYDNYYSFTKIMPLRTRTREQFTNSIMKNRRINETQAALILSRLLEPVGDGKYKLKIDPKMRKLKNFDVSPEMFFIFMTTNAPPMLNISANNNKNVKKDVFDSGLNVMKKVQEVRSDYFIIYVDGDHDLHITHPERFSNEIIEFLNKDFKMTPQNRNINAKL